MEEIIVGAGLGLGLLFSCIHPEVQVAVEERFGRVWEFQFICISEGSSGFV